MIYKIMYSKSKSVIDHNIRIILLCHVCFPNIGNFLRFSANQNIFSELHISVHSRIFLTKGLIFCQTVMIILSYIVNYRIWYWFLPFIRRLLHQLSAINIRQPVPNRFCPTWHCFIRLYSCVHYKSLRPHFKCF